MKDIFYIVIYIVLFIIVIGLAAYSAYSIHRSKKEGFQELKYGKHANHIVNCISEFQGRDDLVKQCIVNAAGPCTDVGYSAPPQKYGINCSSCGVENRMACADIQKTYAKLREDRIIPRKY